MTKLEKANLNEMHYENPVSPTIVDTFKKLWEIGDTVKDTDKPIGHICGYQTMFMAIMLNPYVQAHDKTLAITIFEKWAYNEGRRDERRDTGGALKTSWYEGDVS